MTACFAIFTVFSTCSLLGGPAGVQPVAAQAEPVAWVAQATAPAYRSAPALATTASADPKTPGATRGAAAAALAAGTTGSVTTGLTTHLTTHTPNHTLTHTLTHITTLSAAGSVLVLADGIVADARMAQVLPPAPGFQYER